MSATAQAFPTTNVAPPPARRAAATQMSARKTYLRQTKQFQKHSAEPLDNYAPVPHAFWALAGKEKLSGAAQMSLLGYIMARTWGDPAKPAWAIIALSDFARELKFSTKMIELALADAVDRGLAAVKKSGQQRAYQLCPQNWEGARKYEPKAAKDDDEGEDAAAADEEPLDAGAKSYTGETLVVMPGKRSKVLPLRFAIKGHTDPVELKLDYRNDCVGLPLSISAAAGANGRFSVTVRRAESLTNGEEKAENLRTALRRFDNFDASSSQAADYRKFLTQLLLDRFAKPLDEKLLGAVLENAGDAPVSVYADVVEQRMRRRGHHTTGLLINLASDAARLHAAVKAGRPASLPAVSNDADPDAGLRAIARQDPVEYEAMRAAQAKLGEKWPTLAELGLVS